MLLSEKFCFGFCAFGFEAMPHPSCYLTSIMDKTRHKPVIGLLKMLKACPFNQIFLTVID